jgi:hypothetical protein
MEDSNEIDNQEGQLLGNNDSPIITVTDDSSQTVINTQTLIEKEPGFSDLPLEDKIRYYSLPFFGFFMLFFIWFEIYKPLVIDDWIKGTIYLENSSLTQDTKTKSELVEKGRTILKEELQKHPYHSRIWHLYSQYFLLTNQLDSCIYYEKKAMDMGAGGIVNQIEPLAADKINYCVGVKLNSIHNSLDSSLAVIKVAETPKYYNFMMDKFKGLVFAKYKQLDSSNFYFKRYLVSMPEDGDVFYKLANNYLMQENKKDALLFAEKVKDLYKVNAKVDTLIKKINEL